MEQRWPDVLWVVRHGESAGNVAADAARAAGLPMVQIATRDVDVPLSPRGEEQAAALGRWFASLPRDERHTPRPTCARCTPPRSCSGPGAPTTLTRSW